MSGKFYSIQTQETKKERCFDEVILLFWLWFLFSWELPHLRFNLLILTFKRKEINLLSGACGQSSFVALSRQLKKCSMFSELEENRRGKPMQLHTGSKAPILQERRITHIILCLKRDCKLQKYRMFCPSTRKLRNFHHFLDH